jgi:hypothetical protein
VDFAVRGLENALTREIWTHPNGQPLANLPQAQQNTLLLTVGHILPQILDIFLSEQVPAICRFDDARWRSRTAGEWSCCLHVDPRTGLVDAPNFGTATGPSRRAAFATFLSSGCARIGLRGATRPCNCTASRAPVKRSCRLLVDGDANSVGCEVGRGALVQICGHMGIVLVPGACSGRSSWRSISCVLTIIKSCIRNCGRYWLGVCGCRVHVRILLVLSR